VRPCTCDRRSLAHVERHIRRLSERFGSIERRHHERQYGTRPDRLEARTKLATVNQEVVTYTRAAHG